MVLRNETYVRCDECGRGLSICAEGPLVLPHPWRIVHVDRWVGEFHCCSDPCEKGLRERHQMM